MATYLVTGGAGFIGQHLVRALMDRGDDVVVLDDLSTGRRENIPTSVKFIQNDILDHHALEDAMSHVVGVFHLAASVSVQASIDNWQRSHDVNFVGTARVFEAALARKLPVVFTSSAAIYGDQSGQCCREQSTVPSPISPYGADKLAAEHLAGALAKTSGLSSFALRLFNIYGAGQNAQSPYSGVIAKFIRNLDESQPHSVFGDGSQTRDFVCVDDAVLCLVAAMQSTMSQQGHQTSNVATGQSRSLLDVLDILNKGHPKGAQQIQFESARNGDIAHSASDTARMRDVLTQHEFTSLDAGLAMLIGTDSHSD